jgi:hypothetical protein
VISNIVLLFFTLAFAFLFYQKTISYSKLRKASLEVSVKDSLSKISEIICQQTLIYSYYLDSVRYFTNEKLVAFYFIFFLVHLPLYYFMKVRFATILVVSSLVAAPGIIFLYSFKTEGFLIVILLHISYYICLDYIFKKHPDLKK